MKDFRSIAVFLFVGLAVALSAVALPFSAQADDYISPELVKVTTPVYRPEFSDFDPALGKYTYTVSWQGIPAAEVTVNISQDDQYYRSEVQARTYSGIDLFYKLRYRAEGVVSSFDLTPVRTTIDHQENSRHKNVEVLFGEDGSIDAKRSQVGKDSKELHFNPNNFTLDPFAAALLARSLSWEIGQSRQFDTFNGKSRYLITLTCEDRKTMRINGEERDVWIISPKVVNLTSRVPSKKLRSAQIYVTADKHREILQIVSSVFIGSVKTRMVSFEPSAEPAPTARIARNHTHNLYE
ncbi:MAG: DUF3108 domain-containing protein [Oligoflexia bacterium]|nr:DUF3108 domain-containing protein [Oligoflexia bacterium]